jgi:hypothetical protein
MQMSDRFIMRAFWQKGANCAFVAFIKVGIMKFGARLFNATVSKGTINITLRNGRRISFTAEEIKEINKLNQLGFRRGKTGHEKQQLIKLHRIVSYCFAVLVRQMETRGYEGREYTTASAITALTAEGMQTVYFHSLLGLKRTASVELAENDMPALRKKRAILLFTETHIIAASKGYYDSYGRVIKMRNKLPVLLKKQASGYYTLR